MASHLLKVYNYLLECNLETGKLFEAEVPHFMLVVSKEGSPVSIKLNIDETGIEKVISHLEGLCSSGFDQSGIWEECAKDLLTYQSISAVERMEEDLGRAAVEKMSADEQLITLHDYLRGNNALSSEDLEKQLSALINFCSEQVVQNIIKELNLSTISLADLDKFLGLSLDRTTKLIPTTEATLTDPIVPIPTGSPFVSTVYAHLRKDLWKKDSQGLARFQHGAKANPSNYIEHYITNPGDIEILPWEQAEQIIDKFGFNTVKLHLIFAAHTMNQPIPWEGNFSLKASDIAKCLGWDKRTDLPIHQKLNEIAKTAFVLDCLLVKSVWVEGRSKNGGVNASTPTGRMWNVVVDPRGQLNLEGRVEKPEEVYITVRPGLIFESFLNKAGNKLKEALYQFGYLAQDLLRIDPYHDEVALRLAIHLTMDSRIHISGKYQVATLLKAMLPQTAVEAARIDKRKGYDLKQRWDSALKLLMKLEWQIQFDQSYPDWLQPGREAPKPEDARKVKIIDRLLAAKLTIKPPEPIAELLSANPVRREKKKVQKLQPAALTGLTGDQVRKGREAKGWSQRKLAGWLGVSDVLIGYWEKGKRTPSSEMETKLREVLRIQG